MYLNVHSYYSLRYGTIAPESLALQAKQKGIKALVLTDINNVSGVFDFFRACKENDIKPIVGMEFRRENELLFVTIAKNNNGFREINAFLTKHNVERIPLSDESPEFENVYVIYPLSKEMKTLRENEFIGIAINEFNKIRLQVKEREHKKMVLLQPVTFSNELEYTLHKNLRAIDNNILLSHLQRNQAAQSNEYFYTPTELNKVLNDFPEIKYNTEKIMDECVIDFDLKSIKNKKTFTGSRSDDKRLLEKLAFDGLKYRYGENLEAKKRVLHELEIINELGFASYFLITWDIIRYSMSRGFYHVGRGSGANSVVAYCLKITDVNPIELDLYFERFLNPQRKSPPDFDIDYSWKERDEVIDYIFKRYGKEHTALLGTMSTFKGDSILRDLGKVYGLPKDEIEALEENPLNPLTQDRISKKIFSLAVMMKDFPNMRSIHAGGILISDEPMTSYTALDMPPKGFPTTQWDMYVSESIGFEKFDILSQRGIGHIKESADIIKRNRKISVDVHDIEKFKNDQLVKNQLYSGDTIGCFYIESPAMRGLLKKLRCDNYISLVAASSIIRPGVASSGMMREFINRFHHPDQFEYLHPIMKEQLHETYGVMVYQEDVLKVCHYFAGLDLADADVLRRMMSGKNRDREAFNRLKDKFFINCKERGYPDTLTDEVWRQTESFAGYSFSKAHSASYAAESFQSLYLKTYFPKEFMVAVINNFGGFYSTWVYVNEAKKCGANIQLPCVNKSDISTNIYGDDMYLGFVHLQNLESKFAEAIIGERNHNGVFTSLENFIQRVPTKLEQLIILIRINAFRFTGLGKKQLLWECHLLLGKSHTTTVPANELIVSERKTFVMPKLEHNVIEDVYDEIELLHFPVTQTRFDLLHTQFRGDIKAKDLTNNVGKTVKMVGHYVNTKNVITKTKQYMQFGTFLDDNGNFFDTTHFPDVFKKYPFKGMGVYLILGKVVDDFGFPSIEVEKMAKLPLIPDPRYGQQ